MSNPRKNHNLLASKFYLYQTPNAREDLLEEISHPVPTTLLGHQSTNSQKRKKHKEKKIYTVNLVVFLVKFKFCCPFLVELITKPF